MNQCDYSDSFDILQSCPPPLSYTLTSLQWEFLSSDINSSFLNCSCWYVWIWLIYLFRELKSDACHIHNMFITPIQSPMNIWQTYMTHYKQGITLMTIIQPAYEVRGPEGLCAESAWAVTGRQGPHSGVGEDFLARRPGFYFCENGRYSETKSRKIDPKVPKPASC